MVSSFSGNLYPVTYLSPRENNLKYWFKILTFTITFGIQNLPVMKKMVKRSLFALLLIVLVPVIAGSIFIATLMITEYRPEEVEKIDAVNQSVIKVQPDSVIRLMTFNIGYASLSETEDFIMDGGVKSKPDSQDLVRDNLAGIKDFVEKNKADIFLFQEVDIASNRSFRINQMDELKGSLPGYAFLYAPNFRVAYVPFPLSVGNMIGKVESGIVVASSFTVNSAVRIQLPGEFSWPVRLANLKRSLIVSRLPVEGTEKELVVINGHLSAYDDGSMRSQEMERLKGIMEEEYGKGNYIIIGGDFNQTFPEAEGLFPMTDTSNFVATVISGDFLPSGFRFAVDLTLPTCRLLNKPYNPADPTTQYYLIDGFIISDNITLNSVATVNMNFRYSDHNPVVMEVTLSGVR